MKSLGRCTGRRCGQRTGGTSGVEEFAPGEKGFDQEGKKHSGGGVGHAEQFCLGHWTKEGP